MLINAAVARATPPQQSQSLECRREQLRRLVQQWNENRLDLFNLSYPDENLEIHGVMRFYYQESADRVATKCIRVSSTATTRAVIDALVDRFHPDLKMLSDPEYSLWEVHESGEERCLAADEKPLLVQLLWHNDDREGRFLLRKQDKRMPIMYESKKTTEEGDDIKRSQKRFSKREKKELKKKHQRAIAQEKEEVMLSKQLYKALPPTTFTRTISNPEIVMKKRRERKLETKLKQMAHGGSLKVYGYELMSSRPYVTLLVSVEDQARKILRETLDKYGLDKENISDYVLVQVRMPLSSGKISRSLTDLRSLEDGTTEHYVHPEDYPLLNLDPQVIFVVRKNDRRNPHRQPDPRPADPRFGGHPNPNPDRNPRPMSAGSIGAMATGAGAGGPAASSPAGSRSLLMPGPGLGPGPGSGPGSGLGPGLGPGSAQSGMIYANLPGLPGHPDLPGGGQGGGSGYGYGGKPAVAPHRTGPAGAALLSITPGSLAPNGLKIPLRKGITEMGSSGSVEVRLDGDDFVRPHHAAITFVPETSATITPSVPDALIEVNGEPIHETVILRNGDAITIGRYHAFRFIDQALNMAQPEGGPRNETNFMGNDTGSQRLSPRPHNFGSTPDLSALRRPAPIQMTSCTSEEIPALLRILDEAEDNFLAHLLSDYVETLQFKLAPAFVLYMALRYRLTNEYRQIQSNFTRTMGNFTLKTTQRIRAILMDGKLSKEMYAYWLSNSSEMLNFWKQDIQLDTIIERSTQNMQMECVENALNGLSNLFKEQLNHGMDSLLNPHLDDQSSTNETIETLNEAVYILRKHRVNAALTIQLFSQLFFYLSANLFNWLVSPNGLPYCSRSFGIRLSNRLSVLHNWAKQQGMELPAICHMDKIQQAVNLLVSHKTPNNIATLGATCYKLNSLQIGYLLENMRVEPSNEQEEDNGRISKELMENLKDLSKSQADRIALEDGLGIHLQENTTLQLPFLLPEDGYCSSVLFSVPPSVTSFIGTLQQQGLCTLLPQMRSSSGSWTVHFKGNNNINNNNTTITNPANQQRLAMEQRQFHSISTPYITQTQPPSRGPLYDSQNINGYSSVQNSQSLDLGHQTKHVPRIVQISFSRGNGGIGLSIVAAQGIGERSVGIYVKKVVDGSAAHRDGRLEPGDQLLSINGQSLVGITQSEAAEMMSRSGPMVSFEVNKNAARYNGLEGWLTNPPPSHVAAQLQSNAYGSRQRTESMPSDSQSTLGKQAPPPAAAAAGGEGTRYVRQSSISSSSAASYPLNLPASAGTPMGTQAAGTQIYGSINEGGTGPGGHYQQQQQSRPYFPAAESQLRANRSLSASELYHAQMDSSGSSWPQPQPPKQHHHPLPSHYHRNIQPAAARPTVIQPARPSHSPRAIRRAIDGASPSYAGGYGHSASTSHQLPGGWESSQAVGSIGGSLQVPTAVGGAGQGSWRTSGSTAIPQLSPMSRTSTASSQAHSIDSARFQSQSSNSSIRREELNARLDKLEAKGTSMSETERRTYRAMVDELSRAPIKRPQHLPPPKPAMRTNKSGQSEGGSGGGGSSSSIHHESPRGEQLDKLLEDVKEKMDQFELDTPQAIQNPPQSSSSSPSRRLNDRDDDDNEDTGSGGGGSKKKSGIHWDEKSMEAELEEAKQDDDGGAGGGAGSLEPRVLGAQEVYRDPRQRRLDEMQARQNASTVQVDGASLGFRDKMKLFAEQLGEKTPKSRYKASSAQREIEHSIES